MRKLKTHNYFVYGNLELSLCTYAEWIEEVRPRNKKEIN
jgi:hypothetical protein